jgi:hypothetical protein
VTPATACAALPGRRESTTERNCRVAFRPCRRALALTVWQHPVRCASHARAPQEPRLDRPRRRSPVCASTVRRARKQLPAKNIGRLAAVDPTPSGVPKRSEISACLGCPMLKSSPRSVWTPRLPAWGLLRGSPTGKTLFGGRVHSGCKATLSLAHQSAAERRRLGCGLHWRFKTGTLRGTAKKGMARQKPLTPRLLNFDPHVNEPIQSDRNIS